MPEDVFAYLQGHTYINLTTFRKNGAGVTTPVWFVLQAGKLYIMTSTSTGKVKRIRNNPRVQLTPASGRGKPLGLPTVEGIARILPVGEDAAAKAALKQKYGWQRAAINLVLQLTGRMKEQVHLEVVPA